jgi:XTP/dITP diphosphohydrolase
MKAIPLVLATRNAGKTREIEALVADFPVAIKNLNDFGPLPPVDEDGATFEDNAVKKARFIAKVLGLPAMADDSGLIVEALGGAPGVRSARYAGENVSDSENNSKLLKEMEKIEDRRAAFLCIIAISVPSGPTLIYEGHCEGVITEEPLGNEGFGYDPVFYYPPLQKTFAELSTEEKNQVSHRGQALMELREEFEKVLIWLRQRLLEDGWRWLDHSRDSE